MSSPDGHLDTGTLDELHAVLGEEFAALVHTFVADSELRLASMRRAHAGADATALREAAHSFKGSSMNIGAPRLADLCRDIETLARSGDLPAVSPLLDLVAIEFRCVAELLARH